MLSRLFSFIAALFVAIGLSGAAHAADASAADVSAADKANQLILTLKDGPVVIQLRPDIAPKTVARIKELANSGFYDGIIFHRVIDGFMAQTGDPTGTGAGGSGKNLPAEFSSAPFERGTLGMGLTPGDDNSADSQFFICFAPAYHLNNHYTVFGQVASGMEFVDKIQRGEPPANPDKIIRMRTADWTGK